jgi:acetyl esterase/lipase
MTESIMKKSRRIGLLVLTLAGASLRAGERMPLWPEGKIPDFQDHQVGVMTDAMWLPGTWGKPNPAFKPEEHRMPYIEWYGKAENPNGACIILISGGSYQNCCDVNLVKKMWPNRLIELGYQCVNFVYRTPRPKGLPIYQSAWQDGQRAVRLVRSEAAKRGFDPERIGLISMSAGGHLGVMMATSSLTPAYEKVDELDDLPCHVNAAICNAPAYATGLGAAGGAAPQDGTLVPYPTINPCFKFDAKTCPISFHHGAVDPYSPNGSTLCYREVRKRSVPSELHLYADLGHGAHGLERAVEFLRQLNFDGRLGAEEERRIFTGTHTAEQVCEKLWPEGRVPSHSAAQTNTATLTWFVPKTLKTKAIQVIFPGGAYTHCNVRGEGRPVAEYFNAQGMTAVVVEYRCPRPKNLPKHWTAWQDAQRAIRLVRAGAVARGLDPERIGAMGFSAGGHLTLMTALSSTYPAYNPVDDVDKKVSCRVAWACPIYPAYVLSDGADGAHARGGNDDKATLVPELLFDVNTPPMCFVHGDADSITAMGSVKVWEKLRRMGASSDLHTLATRGHCFQFKAAPGTGSWTWLDQVWDFLVRKGFVK